MACSRATSVVRRAGRVGVRATRPGPRPTASPRRAGGGSLRERAKVARTRNSPSVNSIARQVGQVAPERTINSCATRGSWPWRVRAAVWCDDSCPMRQRRRCRMRGVVRWNVSTTARPRGGGCFAHMDDSATGSPGQGSGTAGWRSVGDTRPRAVLAGLPAGLRSAADSIWAALGPARCAPYRTDGVNRLPVGRLFPAEDAVGWSRSRRCSGEEIGLADAHRSIVRLPACRAAPRSDLAALLARLRSGGSASGFGGAGASKAARSTPNATPSGLTAKVVCNSRPRATAPVWFEPMAPSPCVCPRRVKFRRVPSWMHSTVSCAAHPAQRLLAMRREDVADRHRAVGGLVDQPVMALDHRARAVGGAGDGAHRGHLLRTLHHQTRSPKRAPPNSCSAQTARRDRRQPPARHPVQAPRGGCATPAPTTALRVSGAACVRSWRPRPQVSPTRTQFAARTLAPVCSVSSTNVSSSQGR